CAIAAHVLTLMHSLRSEFHLLASERNSQRFKGESLIKRPYQITAVHWRHILPSKLYEKRRHRSITADVCRTHSVQPAPCPNVRSSDPRVLGLAAPDLDLILTQRGSRIGNL